jgi:hypothetical protein
MSKFRYNASGGGFNQIGTAFSEKKSEATGFLIV